MSVSIKESILENIKTVLEGVTVGAGYNNSLADVQRFQQRGNSISDVPCVVITAGPEDKEDRPDPQKTCTLTVNIDLYLRDDDDDTVNSDTSLNSVLLDIEKALMIDYTRGDYAAETHIRRITPFTVIDGGVNYGAQIEVDVIYKHSRTNPAAYV
jgi:hypothetical protein